MISKGFYNFQQEDLLCNSLQHIFGSEKRGVHGFVTDDRTLLSVCAQTAYFPTDHNGKAIAQELRDALGFWKPGKNQDVSMTTESFTPQDQSSDSE